jgi:hypothetical protein
MEISKAGGKNLQLRFYTLTAVGVGTALAW